MKAIFCKRSYNRRHKRKFFNNPQDLETYTNGFYKNISAPYTDVFSDNISVYTGASNTDNLLRGSLTPANVDGWDWKQLRSINYMIENSGKATGDQSLIRHYKGSLNSSEPTFISTW